MKCDKNERNETIVDCCYMHVNFIIDLVEKWKDGRYMNIQNKPIYPDDRRIELTAYIGPRRAGKRSFNGVYGENPRDTKEGYPSFITDDVFEIYKNAGFSFLMPEGDAFYQRRVTPDGIVKETDFKKSDLYTYMKMAKKHGLKVYPAIEELFHEIAHSKRDFGQEEKKLIKKFVEELQEHFPDTFQGIMLTDEPSHYEMERIGEILDYLRSDEMKQIKPEIDVFSSMLPMYTELRRYHPDCTEIVGTRKQRKEVYQYYLELCGKTMGEFCCDYYALGSDGFLSPTTYQNLEMMAEFGKKKNIPISITLLSNRMDTQYNPKTGHGKGVYRIPSYEDIRWQVYSALAFGVRRIAYYTFWQHYSESNGECYPKAMINYEPSEEKGYRKTEIYYAVAEVNREILAIDHIFLRFRWQGCKVIRKSREHNIRLVKAGYEDSMLEKANATRDLLVGYFQNPEDGVKSYWVVNAKNPYHYEVNDVELTFHDCDRVVYYRKGKEYDAALNCGKFTIRLGTGEGIFVIPYNSTLQNCKD